MKNKDEFFYKEKVVKAMPEKEAYKKEALKELLELLKSSNYNVQSAAAMSLTELLETNPNLAQEAFKGLLELFKSSDIYVQSTAAGILPEVVRADSSLKKEAYKELLELFKSSDIYVQSAAAMSLTIVLMAMSKKEASKELLVST